MKKRTIYITLFLIFIIGVISLIGTFAIDSSITEGNSTKADYLFNITLGDRTNREIVIPSYDSKIVDIKISNPNEFNMSYLLYLEGVNSNLSIINISDNEASGVLNSKTNTLIKVFIQNNSSSDITTSIKDIVGFESEKLSLPSNNTSINKGTYYKVIVKSNDNTYGKVKPNIKLSTSKGTVKYTISSNTGYQYKSNTCNGTVSNNILTISNITSNTTCEVVFEPIQITVNFDLAGGVVETTYTEPKEYTYTVPYNGTYKLETWGAQGGVKIAAGTSTTGYGGYSVGNIKLSKGDVLYINVGGAGLTTSSSNKVLQGGYNGGGKGYSYSDSRGGASGGGATHIATVSGLLSTLSSSIDKILIVSGGGGGSDQCCAGYSKVAGSGGGYVGATGTYGNSIGYGGTQSSGGYGTDNSKPSGYEGSFGQGGNCTKNDCAGGGGGYYGGAAIIGGGGYGSGGSGYIGNLQLTDKYMYCYDCLTSDETDTKTYTTTNVSDIPTSNYAKSGDGAVKITLVDNASYKVTYNAKYSNLPTPTRSGYIFDGWYTGENGTGTKVTSDTILKNSNTHTLYAKWNVIPPSITLSKESYHEGFNGWTFSNSKVSDNILELSTSSSSALSGHYMINGSEWWTTFDGYTTSSSSAHDSAFGSAGAGDGGISIGSSYYDSNYSSATSSNGYARNGHAPSLPLNTWSNDFSFNGYKGYGTKYVDIRFSTGGTYSMPTVKIRNFKLHGRDIYAPFYLINVNATSNNGVATLKYASGNQSISYFTDGGGTSVSNNSIKVTENGTYTVYAADSMGNGSIKTIDIDKVDKTSPNIFAYAGKMLYNDPEFSSGNNNINVYNNLGNGNVTITRSTISGIPNSSGYGLAIKTTGSAKPGHGGFTFSTSSSSNGEFITRIVAKIPKGYSIHFATNATGDNPIQEWLTSQEGTGDWQEYVFHLKCGSTGSYSTTNYFYLSGGSTASTSAPITWYLSYATVFYTNQWSSSNYIISAGTDKESGIIAYGVNQSSTSEPTWNYIKQTNNAGIISSISSMGTYYVWLKDAAGNVSNKAVNSNYYYLDLNGYLDGKSSGNISGYGTADIYVNGVLVANDVSDFFTAYASGTTYSISDIKASTGHTYKGVYSGSTSGTITGGTSVYLNYSTNSYSISYNLNGGSYGSSHPTSGTYGSTVTVSNPSRTGYTFTGWTVSGTGASISGTSLKIGTGNIILTANWKTSDTTKPTCSLSANANTISASASDNVGIAYKGWSSSYSGTNSTSKSIAAGIHTYYVKDTAGNTNTCSINISGLVERDVPYTETSAAYANYTTVYSGSCRCSKKVTGGTSYVEGYCNPSSGCSCPSGTSISSNSCIGTKKVTSYYCPGNGTVSGSTCIYTKYNITWVCPDGYSGVNGNSNFCYKY